MSLHLTRPGELLDAAKRAALDAVAGYRSLTPYTIGVAVQAAAAVLRSDAFDPPAPAVEREALDVTSREITRLQEPDAAA